LRGAAEGGAALHQATPTRSSPEFADYLLEIAVGYATAKTIHLVINNLSTHTRKALVGRFGEKIGTWLWRRFTLHYTPKHGSWLNQAEIEISLLSRQCLGKRRIPSLGDLRREVRAWNRKMNRDRTPINRTLRAPRHA
jgi:transposase